MENIHGKVRHGKQNHLCNNSQQHWDDALKQSIMLTTCSPRCSTHSDTTIAIGKAIQLMNTSPRDLMSLLQQNSSFPQPWKLRTKDMAVQEILRERREAIETGKLKGRRLFEPIQGGRTILNDELSGDMDHENEVRSLSYDYSDDETFSPPPPPPSSLPRLSSDSLDRDQQVNEEEVSHDVCNAEARVSDTRPGNGRRYIIFLGVNVIAIALLIFAICKSWVRRFEDHEVSRHDLCC